MSALTIKINPATFNAGGALAVAYNKNKDVAYPVALRGKTIIPIGSGGLRDSLAGGAGGFPVKYSSATLNSSSTVVGAIEISAGATTFVDSVQLTRMGQWFKNSLADLVTKGIIIVTLGGVDQTAVQILSL